MDGLASDDPLTLPHERRITAPLDSHLDLAARLARRLHDARTEVVRRWLDRIIARVTIEPGHVRLFEQFFRGHGETVTGVEGTGLGLSIVQETVASLGGRVWTEFPDEGGSVFGFSLPSRREEDAAAAGTRRDTTVLMPDGVADTRANGQPVSALE